MRLQRGISVMRRATRFSLGSARPACGAAKVPKAVLQKGTLLPLEAKRVATFSQPWRNLVESHTCKQPHG
jgi:hypothetical protein